VRLGVYADLVYRRDGELVTTDRAFVRYLLALPPRVEELVLFGRLHPEPGRELYPIPPEVARVVPLPYYPDVKDVAGVVRSFGGARKAFERELDRLDAVWLFGPYPVTLLFAAIALRRRKRLFLGVRQDFPLYVKHRLPSRRWAWALGAAYALEAAFVALSRKAPTVVVGEAMGRRYRRAGGRVLATGFSLIRANELVSLDDALARSWDTPELRALYVARLDPDKNPLLLPEIVQGLLERDPRWRLTVVGRGSLGDELARRAQELGVAHALDLRGYVENGPPLWEIFRTSHALLHVSVHEGLPQTIFEAQAAGTPIVGTDVGGVRDALQDGRAGIVIPPRDAAAAIDGLERLRTEPELRRRFVSAGLEQAARETTDAQLDRIYAFFDSSSA
jgi:glycosyltransferase involved in cell wall biosynthesis